MKSKLTTLVLLFLLGANQVFAQTREEIEAAKQAALLKTVGYVALGVVITVFVIAAVWLLVIKKGKDGKIKVKTHSAKDTYNIRGGRGQNDEGGFSGGF